MDPSTVGLWTTVLIIAVLVAYAGVEETMRLFAYIDLQIRYAWIRFRMEMMRRKLKKQLDLLSFPQRTTTMTDGPVFKMDRVECEKCGAV